MRIIIDRMHVHLSRASSNVEYYPFQVMLYSTDKRRILVLERKEGKGMDKYDFLYPHNSYRGDFQPNSLVFNANLQEFSQAVGYIVNLQTGGKISPLDAYKQIKKAYKVLKHSKKALEIDNNSQ